MPAPGKTPIILYHSETTTNEPSPANLNVGELGINITDIKGWTKDTAGNLVLLFDGSNLANVAYKNGATVNFTGTLQNGGSNVLVDTDIDSSVQAYSATIAKTDVNNTFSTYQTFSAAVFEKLSPMGGANNEIGLRLGNVFTKTITGNTVLTVANVPATSFVGAFLLELTNGGAYTITWWTGCRFSDGVAPVLTASGTDILGFYTHDGGTTWKGFVVAYDVQAP